MGLAIWLMGIRPIATESSDTRDDNNGTVVDVCTYIIRAYQERLNF